MTTNESRLEVRAQRFVTSFACVVAMTACAGQPEAGEHEEIGARGSALLPADLDLNLGNFEPHAAVNPNNPSNIVVALQCPQGTAPAACQLQLTIATTAVAGVPQFGAPVLLPLPAGFGSGGDAVMAFDTQGNLFVTWLGCAGGPESDKQALIKKGKNGKFFDLSSVPTFS